MTTSTITKGIHMKGQITVSDGQGYTDTFFVLPTETVEECLNRRFHGRGLPQGWTFTHTAF